MPVTLYHGDCLDVIKTLPDNSISSIVTDPPYGLSDHSPADIIACLTAWLAGQPYAHKGGGMMGKSWDSFVPGPEIWRECLRVLKNGGNLLAFAGTRTQDLMGISIRLAGFEIRDSFAWLHSQGMPKGLNISKKIDQMAGVTREIIGTKINTYDGAIRDPSKHGNPADQSHIGKWGLTKTPHGMPMTVAGTPEAAQWEGWHSAVKGCFEPLVMARKPLDGTIVENVLKHHVGGYNIDACRLPINPAVDDARLGGVGSWKTDTMAKNVYGEYSGQRGNSSSLGRFAPNVGHDDSDAVLEAFASFGNKTSGIPGTRKKAHNTHSMAGRLNLTDEPEVGYGDDGSIARFYYAGKVSPSERGSSRHPTLKPLSLMKYLIRLTTPKGGLILDPFAGSGTTGQAAIDEGFDAILIEREQEYVDYIRNRLGWFISEDHSI